MIALNKLRDSKFEKKLPKPRINSLKRAFVYCGAMACYRLDDTNLLWWEHGIHLRIMFQLKDTKFFQCLLKQQPQFSAWSVFYYYYCVVAQNIQTPTTEEISLRTPPPPWIFHFCRELMTPHPFGISTSVTKTPQPLWKSSFSRRKTIKVEEWGNLWLVPNGFHQKLVCFCFHLFEWSRNIKTHYTTTK